MAGELLFDGGDGILADAEGVVAAEGEVWAGLVLVDVGDDKGGGEAGDLEGVGAGVGVGVAAEDPGLVELVHGAELGFAVDAEVEGDVGVDFRSADEPLVFCVTYGDEQGAARAGDEQFGVDPEGHHDVLGRSGRAPGDVVEVAEVGEVACVGDGDGVVFRGEEMDEFGWSCRLLAVDGGDHVRGAFEGVKRQAVEEKGQACAFGVQGGDGGIGAIAAGDALARGWRRFPRR